MTFGHHIDGVFGYLDDQVLLRHNHLAAKARVWVYTPGFVEKVFFQYELGTTPPVPQ